MDKYYLLNGWFLFAYAIGTFAGSFLVTVYWNIKKDERLKNEK